MRNQAEGSLLPAVMASLLLAGIFAPAAVLGQLGASTQTQGQLASLVGVAQTSRAYASSTVDIAASHGLDVSAAQAQLALGDSLLATAQADAQTGSNISAGILAVQSAMRDFTYAAASAGIALENAHLTAYVIYSAAASAIAEVNASATVVAVVTAKACAGVGSSDATALAQACAEVKADVASAAVQLREAATLLVQANGGASANFDYSQVLSLVASARAEVGATQSAFAAIAASTYPQRGHAFVVSVVNPLAAEANSTIKSEQSVHDNLSQFQTSFNNYAQGQMAAAANVASSASALATDIAQVDVSSVYTSISTAQHTATEVGLNMTALVALVSASLFPTVVADIRTCSSTAASYDTALGAAATQSAAYGQTQLPSFAAYVSAMSSSASSAQNAGSAYVSACAKVMTDISTLFSISGVQAIYNALVSLQISATAAETTTSLQQEVAAMATVQTGITSFTSTVTSTSVAILLGSNLVSTSDRLSTQASAYLNATARAAASGAAASVNATAQAAQSFVASAGASLKTTISGFAASSSGLSGQDASLGLQTQSSLSSTASASAYIKSDITSRTAEVATGQVEVSQALQLFSNAEVSGGAAAMAQACLELQAASAVNA